MAAAIKYLLLPLLALDVAANVLLCLVGAVFALDASMVSGSWRQTLSARAGHMAEKHQPYFSWPAKAIDAIFSAGHCMTQWRREQRYGGAWGAFLALVRGQ